MYYNTMKRMKENITDGSEFCESGVIIPNVSIGHTTCDYCQRKIIAVWDEHNKNNYWSYLGNQVKKPHVYRYSKIIQAIKKKFDALDKVWTNENGNNLLNVHARAHSSPTDWSTRASEASIRLLCNECFQKTYNRIKVQGSNNTIYALSVVLDRGETIESVMKDLGISGKVIGKGGIIDYD